MIKREHVDSEDRCKWNNNDEVLQHIVFDAEEKSALRNMPQALITECGNVSTTL